MNVISVDVFSMYINDQPVGVGEEEGIVVCQMVNLEHDARPPGLKLRHSDLLQKAVVHFECLAYERRSQLDVIKIEEDSIWMVNALGFEFDFLLKVNGDSSVIGGCPVPDAGNAGQFAALSPGSTVFPVKVILPGESVGLSLLFFCVLPLLFRLLRQFTQRLFCIVSKSVARIAVQKFLKSNARLAGVIEFILVDLANGEQRVEPVFASRIFAAQEFVLMNGGAQDVVIVEAASHLHQQLSYCDHAGIGFGGGRRTKVDAAVGVNHALVFVAASVSDRTAVQRFAHVPGSGESLASPVFPMARTGTHGQR